MEKQNLTFAQEAARLAALLTQIFLGMPYGVRTFARALTQLEDKVRRWLWQRADAFGPLTRIHRYKNSEAAAPELIPEPAKEKRVRPKRRTSFPILMGFGPKRGQISAPGPGSFAARAWLTREQRWLGAFLAFHRRLTIVTDVIHNPERILAYMARHLDLPKLRIAISHGAFREFREHESETASTSAPWSLSALPSPDT